MRNLDDIHRISREPGNKSEFGLNKPQIRVHIIPAIEEEHQAGTAQLEIQAKAKKRNYKIALLTAFTIFVLAVGAFFGGRFVSLARDVSTSREGIYKTVTDNIGATLGPIFPGLKTLDNSVVADS